MSDTATPSNSSFWVTLAAAVGGFAIFILILLIAYLPKKPEPLAEGVRTPEQRKAALAELHAHEVKVSTSYGWVDQSKGVVQLPITRAMELTLHDLTAKK